MEQSILKSTKKILGIGLDDESFDLDVITLINEAFSSLYDLGVGPSVGFAIEDDEAVWADFLPDTPMQLNRTKTFIYLKARQVFDPPATSNLVDAMEKQILKQEWLLNVNREATEWVDPEADVVVVDDP